MTEAPVVSAGASSCSSAGPVGSSIATRSAGSASHARQVARAADHAVRLLGRACTLVGMAVPPVVIYPPDEDGGRRVRIDGAIVGRAFSVLDVARYLQEAGLQEADEMDVVRSLLIEWRGGGPDVWTP